MKKYREALKESRELPTHINGELQPHYKMFDESARSYKLICCDNPTAVSVFKAAKIKSNNATKYYIQKTPTYREDGTMKKMTDWKEKLIFHKAWSRNDVEVKNVSFDIVGIKRQTKHISAGVLIDNIKFSI